MKKEEYIFQGYEFSFENGADNSYIFQIVAGIIYEIKFKPSPYLFSNALFANYTYEFSLALIYKPPDYINLPDILLAPTVINIFLDFYNRFDNNNITVYICDSLDYKQHVRKRKFDTWFNEYNKGMFVKLDEEIKDTDGIEYPVAIIIKPLNPYRQQIFEAFISLIDSYNDGK